jgi:PhnB protein
MATLTPYLLFDGNCKQAMEFYKTCLGGELTLTTVGDSAMRDQMSAEMHSKVLNARLKSQSADVSASDWLAPNETPIRGNMVCLYLSGGPYGEIKGLFDKLSEGADVTDPLHEMPFGTYGALNDKFGVRWMFHTDSES